MNLRKSHSGPLSPLGERARVRGFPTRGLHQHRSNLPQFALVACLVLGTLGLEAQETPPGTAGEAAPSVAPAATPTDTAPEDIVPGEAFVNANAAYESGDFPLAISLYEKLIASGFDNGHAHYNLGNAYLRNGELGRAIASYRRASSLLPRDEDVRANLTFARKSAKDALAPPEPSAVERTLFFWHYGLSRAELGTLVAVLNALFWAVLILRIYRRGSEALRWIFIAVLLLLLITGGSLAIRHFRPQRVAVIVPQEVDVRSGTTDTALVLFKLHAGTEVRVVDRREGTLRIALPEAGRGGWIDARHTEVVKE